MGQIYKNLVPEFTVFFIRAPQRYMKQYGMHERYANAQKPRPKMGLDKAAKRRFAWVECVHPVCASAYSFNMAAVPVGVTLKDDKTPKSPLYKLVSCKNKDRGIENSPEGVAKRVQRCNAQLKRGGPCPNSHPLERKDPRTGTMKCFKQTSYRFEVKDNGYRCKQGEVDCGRKQGFQVVTHNGKYGGHGLVEVGPLEPPSCAIKATLRFSTCNTCCCKQGTISTGADLALIHGTQMECGPWLSTTDMMVRTFLSVVRLGAVIDRYGERCFSKLDSDNINVDQRTDYSRHGKATCYDSQGNELSPGDNTVPDNSKCIVTDA